MSLCRACLVILSEQDVIFDLIEDKNLAIKFQACTTIIEFNPDDDTPKCLCSACYHLLDKFYDFQRMCAESLHNFNTLLYEAQLHGELLCIAKQQDNVVETHNEIVNEAGVSWIECIQSGKEVVWELTVDENSEQLHSVQEIPVNQNCDIIEGQPIDITNGTDVLQTRNFHGREQKIIKRKLSCSICTQKFLKPELLNAHILLHQGKNPYCCADCKKSFNNHRNLKEHIDSVHNVKYFNCTFEHCNKVYRTERSLKHHIRSQHANQFVEMNEKFICEICGKGYKRKSLLTRHHFIHVSQEQRPFACTYCDKRFYVKQFLLNHLNRHTGERPFKCLECNEAWPTIMALSRHKREKHSVFTRGKWKCMECSKCFSNSTNLRSHKLVVHLGVKKYVCKYCGEHFAKREHLSHHEFRHTGEKPFQCSICKKGFIQKTAYKCHIQRAHRERAASFEINVETI